jgi:hypothetical protein
MKPSLRKKLRLSLPILVTLVFGVQVLLEYQAGNGWSGLYAGGALCGIATFVVFWKIEKQAEVDQPGQS